MEILKAEEMFKKSIDKFYISNKEYIDYIYSKIEKAAALGEIKATVIVKFYEDSMQRINTIRAKTKQIEKFFNYYNYKIKPCIVSDRPDWMSFDISWGEE